MSVEIALSMVAMAFGIALVTVVRDGFKNLQKYATNAIYGQIQLILIAKPYDALQRASFTLQAGLSTSFNKGDFMSALTAFLVGAFIGFVLLSAWKLWSLPAEADF